MENQYNTTKYNYFEEDRAWDKYGIEEPYFKINGHKFNVSINADTKSEINIVKNKMYVPGKSWGYTDMQWTNFTGETISLEVYSRVTDIYQGEPVQPDNGGIPNFYTKGGGNLTPHGVLKYWAQTFTTCYVETPLHAFENGKYKIDEFSQSQPDTYFVVTKMSLVQYEDPDEIEQTYHRASELNVKDTSMLNALVKEIEEMDEFKQTCGCTSNTDAVECHASPNEDVRTFQKHLQEWGYFPTYSYGTGSIDANGRFCYHTTQALMKFQQDCGIEVTGNFDEVTKNCFIKKLEGI